MMKEMAGTERLNVIALISGGKDSLFSLLHCLANGHNVVALANLHPPSTKHLQKRTATSDTAAASVTVKTSRSAAADTSTGSNFDKKERAGSGGNDEEEEELKDDSEEEEEETDLESHMYQTIGHSVISLYSSALSLPLYRQAILGSAVNTSRTYTSAKAESSSTQRPANLVLEKEGDRESDETESLIPLLHKVLAAHPEANAVCTGAILSTYQRTRIESICLRLGLTPLSYLWQFPMLPPYMQDALLQDMQHVGMQARIVKVASGGLGEEHLWTDITDTVARKSVERGLRRFASTTLTSRVGSTVSAWSNGEILGEGGEFETLALDGPWPVWTKRLLVPGAGWSSVRGEGGAWAVKFTAKPYLQNKDCQSDNEQWIERLRVPPLWDEEFLDLLRDSPLAMPESSDLQERVTPDDTHDSSADYLPASRPAPFEAIECGHDGVSVFTISNISAPAYGTIEGQTNAVITDIRQRLEKRGTNPDDIAFTTIILHDMRDFAAMNSIYSTLFQLPNPPARVTVACGDMLPKNTLVVVSITVQKRSEPSRMRGLHVQSRSYWAPANIGPYSQAVPMFVPERTQTEHVEDYTNEQAEVVHVAGQIPLVPASMAMLSESCCFRQHAALALQHLWRIGREMHVRWWSSGLAFIPACDRQVAAQRAKTAGAVWRAIHTRLQPVYDDTDNEDDGDGEDIAEKNLRRPWTSYQGASQDGAGLSSVRADLPDWRQIEGRSKGTEQSNDDLVPACFVAEVASLPRDAPIEWCASGLNGRVIIGQSRPASGREISGCRFSNACFETRTRAIGLGRAGELTDWEQVLAELHEGIDLSRCMTRGEVYTSPNTPKDMVEALRTAAVIPCRSIWSGKGDELQMVIKLDIYTNNM